MEVGPANHDGWCGDDVVVAVDDVAGAVVLLQEVEDAEWAEQDGLFVETRQLFLSLVIVKSKPNYQRLEITPWKVS